MVAAPSTQSIWMLKSVTQRVVNFFTKTIVKTFLLCQCCISENNLGASVVEYSSLPSPFTGFLSLITLFPLCVFYLLPIVYGFSPFFVGAFFFNCDHYIYKDNIPYCSFDGHALVSTVLKYSFLPIVLFMTCLGAFGPYNSKSLWLIFVFFLLGSTKVEALEVNECPVDYTTLCSTINYPDTLFFKTLLYTMRFGTVLTIGTCTRVALRFIRVLLSYVNIVFSHNAINHSHMFLSSVFSLYMCMGLDLFSKYLYYNPFWLIVYFFLCLLQLKFLNSVYSFQPLLLIINFFVTGWLFFMQMWKMPEDEMCAMLYKGWVLGSDNMYRLHPQCNMVYQSANPPERIYSSKYRRLVDYLLYFVLMTCVYIYWMCFETTIVPLISTLCFVFNSFVSSWTTQGDRDYSKSKAERRAIRSSRSRYQTEKQKAVDEFFNSEKSRRRKANIMDAKTLKISQAELELDELFKQLNVHDDPQRVKCISNDMIKCTKRISKLTASVAKLGGEISVASSRSDSTFQHLMTYNSNPTSILDSVMSCMSHLKIDGDKAKLGLGIYSEFSNFCRCTTKKDYVDFCISVLSRFLPGECISSNLTKLQTIFGKSLKGNMETQGLKNLMDLPTKPLSKIIKSIIGLIVVLSLGAGFVKKENLPDVVSFALDIPKKIDAFDIMGYTTKAIQFCSTTLPFYDGKMCWDELLNGTTTAQIVANEMATLSQQYMLYKCGDPLAKEEKGLKLSLPDCHGRASSLADKLCRDLKFKKGSEASVLRREHEKVCNWKNFFLEKMMEEEIVIAPYMMAFRSVPGVGKTSLQRFFSMFVAKNNGFPYGEHDIACRNPDDKFESRDWKSIMMIDDYHQCLKEQRESNETLWIIRAANMQRMMAVSADLESKGRIPINPNVLTISGNGTEWRPEQDITEPTAFLRRINLDITNIVPLPQFRKRDSICLDSSLVNGATDLWEMKAGYFSIESRASGVPRAIKKFFKQDFSTTVNIAEAYNFKVSELLDFVLCESRSHYANQRLVKTTLDNIGQSWCDHEVDGVTKSYIVGACPVCIANPPALPVEPLEAVAEEAVAGLHVMGHQNVFGFTLKSLFPFVTTITGWIYYCGVFQKFLSWLPANFRWFCYHFVWSYVFYYFGVFLITFASVLLDFRRTTVTVKISHFLYRQSSFFLKDVYQRSKSAIVEFVEKHKTCIIVILSVSMVLACYHFSHQSAVSFGDKPDEWAQQNVNHEVFLNTAKTTSYDDAVRMIQNNIVSFRLTYADGVVDRGNAIPYRGHYYIMNKHYFPEARIPKKMEITRYDISAPQSRYTQLLDEDFIFKIPNSDLVVVFLPKTMRCNDFSEFFTDRFPMSPVKCNQYYKDCTGKVESTMVVARPAPCRTKCGDFYDKCFTYNRPCFRGMCGAPLVSISKRPVIMGIHWAGSDEGLHEGSSAFIDKNWIEQGISVISSKTMIREGACLGKMSMQSYIETPLCGKNSFSYLGLEGTLTYLGKSEGPIVNNRKAGVFPTELHDVIKDKTGYEPRGPHVEANWSPVFAAQETMVHDTGKEIEWTYLKMARLDWLVNVFKRDKVVKDLVNLRVLSNQESLDGTSVPGEEKMKLNTSKGASYLGFGGKKSVIFERSLDGVTTPPPGFFDKVAELEDLYDKGYTSGMPFLQCLKQEVLFKDKARIFSANPVEHLALMRKYFLPLCSLLRRHNEVFENAVGANVYGPDWKAMMGYVTKFGEDRMGFGDYKNYDQSLEAIEILISFSCLIYLAERSGNYTPRDIRIMWGIAHDIANPIYIGNGAFYGASGTSPSGHPLTTILNCVTNSMRHRAVYYKANRHVAKPLFVIDADAVTLSAHNPDNFSNNVALMVQGDDNVYSSSERVQFGMLTMKNTLSDWGIIYTAADKEGDIEKEYGHLVDMTFLKRSVGHMPEIPYIVAPLAVKSIWKPLMMQVPSDVLTPSQQLAEAINSSMTECFYHGREFYDGMCVYLQDIIKGKSVEQFVDIAAFRPFDTRVQLWHETFMVEQ